jgi:hypothetical protein
MTDMVIACGRCQAPLTKAATSQSAFTLACPICGESDTFDNIRREVDEFRLEQSAHMLGDTLGPQRNYRFIAIEFK